MCSGELCLTSVIVSQFAKYRACVIKLKREVRMERIKKLWAWVNKCRRHKMYGSVLVSKETVENHKDTPGNPEETFGSWWKTLTAHVFGRSQKLPKSFPPRWFPKAPF